MRIFLLEYSTMWHCDYVNIWNQINTGMLMYNCSKSFWFTHLSLVKPCIYASKNTFCDAALLHGVYYVCTLSYQFVTWSILCVPLNEKSWTWWYVFIHVMETVAPRGDPLLQARQAHLWTLTMCLCRGAEIVWSTMIFVRKRVISVDTLNVCSE